MKNKHIVLAGIGVLFLLAGIIYMQQTQDNKGKGNGEIIEELYSDITTFSSLVTPNTKIGFKDKDMFKYEELIYGDKNRKNYTFIVSLERVNGHEVYIINATYGNEEGALNIKYYVDKNTYKIIKIEGISIFPDSKVIEGELASIIGNEMSGMGMLFYGHWMLGLDETFKLKEEIRGKFAGRDGTIVAAYDFMEKERIGDREAYKVKINIKHKINGQEVNKWGITWVDKEKRVVIKFVEYHENLPIKEITLLYPSLKNH